MHLGAPAESQAGPHQDRYRVVSIPATDTLFRHTVDPQPYGPPERHGGGQPASSGGDR
jgi:hypothetical protein